jgi:hypothetical protein
MVAAIGLLGVLVATSPAAADAEGVVPGVPADVPGPVWLHRPPTSAAPFTNAGRWKADPLRVSGASAYVDGEFLFQDWIYDAFGADTTDLVVPPIDSSPSTLTGFAGAPTGDVANPTDAARYGGNAADLLEVRVRAVEEGIAYRFTLNTLLAPDAVAIAVAIDSDPSGGRSDWGYGLGSLGPDGIDDVLVTWGSGALFNGVAVPASVDLTTNQIEVVIPAAPGAATWRHWLVTGVWDAGFAPVELVPTATRPGGSYLTNPPPVLNVGFRRDDQEPMGTDVLEGLGNRGLYGWGNYRDHAQAIALADRDISRFHADIDFGQLADGATAYDGPTTGFVNRLYSSRLDLGEGVRSGLPDGGSELGDLLLGPVQPYAVYVPTTYDPSVPAPLTLLLHSAALVYNQYGVQTPELLQWIGEERGSIVITPEARGPFNGYGDVSEVDVFEAIADLAHEYSIDFERVALAGNSMGGIGSFRLAALYPDLFTSMFSIVGEGTEVIDLLGNLRNVPVLMWNALADELVPLPDYQETQRRLDDLGLRHRLDLFLLHDHIAAPLGTGTDFRRGAAFLGSDPIDRDPSHVTYTVVPAMADPQLELRYEGAYWVDGLEVAPGAAAGTADATSYARGHRAPIPQRTSEPGADPELHLASTLTWAYQDAVTRPEVALSLTDLVAATVDLTRAGLDPAAASAAVAVATNQGSAVTLAGVPAGTGVLLDGALVATVTGEAVTVDLPAGAHRVTFAAPGRPAVRSGRGQLPATGGEHTMVPLLALAAALVLRRLEQRLR